MAAILQQLVFPEVAGRTQTLAGGYFMDVQAKGQDLQVDGMTVMNVVAGSTVMFLYCSGSHVGKETVPGSWTIAGQTLVKEGNVPTAASFSVPVVVRKGESVGFYVFCKQGGLLVRSSVQDEILIEHSLARVKSGKQIEKDEVSWHTKGYVFPLGSLTCHAVTAAVVVDNNYSPVITASARSLPSVPEKLVAQENGGDMGTRIQRLEETLALQDGPDFSAILARLSTLEETLKRQAATEARVEIQDERLARLEQEMPKLIQDSQAETKAALAAAQDQAFAALRVEIAEHGKNAATMTTKLEQAHTSLTKALDDGLGKLAAEQAKVRVETTNSSRDELLAQAKAGQQIQLSEKSVLAQKTAAELRQKAATKNSDASALAGIMSRISGKSPETPGPDSKKSSELRSPSPSRRDGKPLTSPVADSRKTTSEARKPSPPREPRKLTPEPKKATPEPKKLSTDSKKPPTEGRPSFPLSGKMATPKKTETRSTAGTPDSAPAAGDFTLDALSRSRQRIADLKNRRTD